MLKQRYDDKRAKIGNNPGFNQSSGEDDPLEDIPRLKSPPKFFGNNYGRIVKQNTGFSSITE